VLLFVPGLTAGAIAGERERQTLLPLQVTLLRPRSIVVGKVLAGASFLVLLLVASLPVLVVSYMLGGINLVDSLRGLGVVLFVAVSLTVMIAAISAMIRRVQTATLVAYTFVALLVVIAPLVYLTLGVIDAGSGDDKVNPPAVVLTVNPLVVVADASAGVNVTNADTPMSGIAQGLAEAKELTSDKWFTWFPDDRLDNQFDDVNGVQRTGFPGWAIGMMALSVLAFVMALGGERRLRTPAETER
jgi:ABC-type transport system involved in multi-copper enzyme maturation permease subunit